MRCRVARKDCLEDSAPGTAALREDVVLREGRPFLTAAKLFRVLALHRPDVRPEMHVRIPLAGSGPSNAGRRRRVPLRLRGPGRHSRTRDSRQDLALEMRPRTAFRVELGGLCIESGAAPPAAIAVPGTS